jgi:hypothetical protein
LLCKHAQLERQILSHCQYNELNAYNPNKREISQERGALFFSKADGAALLHGIICVMWIRLKYPHHFSPSSPIPSCYSLNKTNWQLFALPCFLVDFPSSALAASLTVVIHFFCFFPSSDYSARGDNKRNIWSLCFFCGKISHVFALTPRDRTGKNKQVVSLQLVVVAPPPLCSSSRSSSRVSGFDCPNAILVL